MGAVCCAGGLLSARSPEKAWLPPLPPLPQALPASGDSAERSSPGVGVQPAGAQVEGVSFALSS